MLSWLLYHHASAPRSRGRGVSTDSSVEHDSRATTAFKCAQVFSIATYISDCPVILVPVHCCTPVCQTARSRAGGALRAEQKLMQRIAIDFILRQITVCTLWQ